MQSLGFFSISGVDYLLDPLQGSPLFYMPQNFGPFLFFKKPNSKLSHIKHSQVF